MKRTLKTRAMTVSLAALFVFTPLLGACMRTDSQGNSNNAPAAAADVEYTLQTVSDGSGLGFVGVGGDIDGVRNPTPTADAGATVKVTLRDGDGSVHDISFPDFGVTAPQVTALGDESTVTFTADTEGEFEYFCTLPGHKQAGMSGTIVVGAGAQNEPATAPDISRDPANLPPPIGERGPESVRLDIETNELEGQLADGTTFTYWTFNSTVPGPFLRVRFGDSVELHLRNSAESQNTHSIDLHAVTGPGGGAAVTQVAPGEEKMFTFQPINPGLYVYHCATPSVPHHIAQGMYGLILVEPEGGLPPVDREYYVMQGEVYTADDFGVQGHQDADAERMADEDAAYFVLNGSVGSLTDRYPLTAQVGETVRIYFGVGGPNATSSFHVIGEIFDRVYEAASLTSPPLTNVQTTSVAPGGATVVEFKVEVPGRYLLVDHALSRLEKGSAGYLVVDGPENHDIFFAPDSETSGSGH